MRYENIFKKLMQNELQGKSEKVSDVAARTPKKEYAALANLDKVLPTEKPKLEELKTQTQEI